MKKSNPTTKAKGATAKAISPAAPVADTAQKSPERTTAAFPVVGLAAFEAFFSGMPDTADPDIQAEGGMAMAQSSDSAVYDGMPRTAGELERRQAEEQLRESELRYRILANSGQALIWTSGLDKACDCVKTYVTSFGAREKFSMEYRLRHCSGDYRWLQDDGTPRFDSDGNFLGYIGHCLDITERKQAEELLQKKMLELERFYKLTVDRELKMIELKQEINALLKQTNQREKYQIVK